MNFFKNDIHREFDKCKMFYPYLYYADVTPQMLEAIRLAKYWAGKVNLHGTKIHGNSFIVELITLEANRISEGEDLEEKFVKFLKTMQNLGEQKIILTKEYSVEDIPARLLFQRPLIMDPANCWDNLGEQFQPGQPAYYALTYYKQAADLALAKIEGARLGDAYYKNPANWF